MRTFGIVFLVVMSVLPGQGQKAIKKIDDLRGMAGCWERRDAAKKLLMTERWMSPAGTSILGMGRTVKDGKTTNWEFMRIEQRSDGIYFVAKPRQNNEDTSFKLTSLLVKSSSRITSTTFPSVSYKFAGARLIGRIEGMNNGKFLGIDFPMERVNCL